jgi:hypothetical protein
MVISILPNVESLRLYLILLCREMNFLLLQDIGLRVISGRDSKKCHCGGVEEVSLGLGERKIPDSVGIYVRSLLPPSRGPKHRSYFRGEW